jgi:hypothetical protein
MYEYSPTQFPAHLEVVPAQVLERKRANKSSPVLEESRLEVIRTIRAMGARMPIGVAVLEETSLLSDLLEPHWQGTGIEAADITKHAIVLYLPAIYSEAATKMLASGPGVFNALNLNLRNNGPYVGWYAYLAGETQPTMIRLPASDIFDELRHSRSNRYDEKEWEWVPVIVVAGDYLSVGGFAIDELFHGCLQAASTSASSTLPEEVYCESELQVAAEQASIHGLSPWQFTRWWVEGEWTVQPTLFLK